MKVIEHNKVAEYLRLSREDGDKMESDSIKNQRDLVRDYLAKHPDLRHVAEYVDDGYGLVDTADGFLHFLLMLPLPIQMRLELDGVGIRERKLLGWECLADKPAVYGNGNRGWRQGFLHGVVKNIRGGIHVLCQRIIPVPHILKADPMPPDFTARSVVHFQSAQSLPAWRWSSSYFFVQLLIIVEIIFLR